MYWSGTHTRSRYGAFESGYVTLFCGTYHTSANLVASGDVNGDGTDDIVMA